MTSDSDRTHIFTFRNVILGSAALIATVYGAHYIISYRTKRIITRKENWCNWKHETSFEHLITLPRYKLSRELIEYIQARYINKHNPADHVYPMTKFIDEINRETRILRNYMWTIKKTEQLRIARFLPGANMAAATKNRLERLAYLKALFFDWAQEYRFTRSQTSKLVVPAAS